MAIFGILKRLVNAEAAGRERRVDERVRTTFGAHVLVVDDSATIRAVLGKMLAQDGYQVLKAADGETAVDMAQSQVPDLIFLDIVLPGMSGFSVLRALRREEATRTTPIIMMSGNQQATEQFYVQRFGADSFIRKPFGRAEVFHAIRALVHEGRMPARSVPPPSLGEIPEGISAEEWAAIPDVAMPDEGQMTEVYGASEDSAAAGVATFHDPGNGETVIRGEASSMTMHPTLMIGQHAATAPKITLHVDETEARGAEASTTRQAHRGSGN